MYTYIHLYILLHRIIGSVSSNHLLDEYVLHLPAGKVLDLKPCMLHYLDPYILLYDLCKCSVMFFYVRLNFSNFFVYNRCWGKSS